MMDKKSTGRPKTIDYSKVLDELETYNYHCTAYCCLKLGISYSGFKKYKSKNKEAKERYEQWYKNKYCKLDGTIYEKALSGDFQYANLVYNNKYKAENLALGYKKHEAEVKNNNKTGTPQEFFKAVNELRQSSGH